MLFCKQKIDDKKIKKDNENVLIHFYYLKTVQVMIKKIYKKKFTQKSNTFYQYKKTVWCFR